MRVGPIGPSPSSVRRRRWPPANALRSAPAQNTPSAPLRIATLALSSASNARNASASASRVGSSTAFRTSGRSMMTLVTGPCFSTRTVLMQVLRSVAGDGRSGGLGVLNHGPAGSGLDDGDDETDGREDVADAHAFGLGRDLDDGLAGVVDLPRDLPTLGLAALDRFLKLSHHLLERVAVAVVEDGHPGRGDRTLGDVLDVRERRRLLGHHEKPRGRSLHL